MRPREVALGTSTTSLLWKGGEKDAVETIEVVRRSPPIAVTELWGRPYRFS